MSVSSFDMKKSISRKVISGLILEISTLLLFFLGIIINSRILVGVALVCLIIGGVLGLVFSYVALNEIKKQSLVTGKGLAVIGLITGIFNILFFMIVFPNFVTLPRTEREFTTKTSMNRIRLSLEDFSAKNDGQYPCSMEDTTRDGKRFFAIMADNFDFASFEMTNPYTQESIKVKFMSKDTPFPSQDKDIDIPPGDIYVYSNGLQYMILGGGADGEPLSLRLTSRE